jgi:DNA-binding LacI/PurR family transcriptional regulator
LINYNAHIPESLIQQVHRNHIPAVWINAKLAEPCVHPDEEDAGYQAARHLLKMGHRRIAYLCSGWPDEQGIVRPTLTHFSVVDRQAGYARAMHEAGLSPQHMVVQTCMGDDLHVRTFTELLRQPELPTAMIVTNRHMASSLCFHAMQLGIKMPEQLSVVTFENEFQPAGNLAIDAVVTPDIAIGQQAAKMVCQIIEDPTLTPQPLAMRCALHPGHTCARPQQV